MTATTDVPIEPRTPKLEEILPPIENRPVDAIQQPNKGVRQLMNNNPLEIELRGYELARRVGNSWVRIATYRPNEDARKLAVADANWHTMQDAERAKQFRSYVPTEYAVRPVVSLNPTSLIQVNEPLVLDADSPEEANAASD